MMPFLNNMASLQPGDLYRLGQFSAVLARLSSNALDDGDRKAALEMQDLRASCYYQLGAWVDCEKTVRQGVSDSPW